MADMVVVEGHIHSLLAANIPVTTEVDYIDPNIAGMADARSQAPDSGWQAER